MSNNVSITIPVRGQENLSSLRSCLVSLENQSYKNFEVILVGAPNDLKNFEFTFRDKKLKLKKVYAVVDKNEARNIGFTNSEGSYILYLDHDMRADGALLADCLMRSREFEAIIIPEKGERGNFWANCRKLEKELIVYDLDSVTPRFFKRSIFKGKEMPFDSKFGLLDEWGFNVKIRRKKVSVGTSKSFLTVSEKSLSLDSAIKNKFLRGLWMKNFYNIDKQEAWRRIDPIKRGLIFYTKRVHYLTYDPMHFLGLLVLKSLDLTFFLLGYLFSILGLRESYRGGMVQTYNNYGNVGERYLKEMYLEGRWNQYVDSSEKEEIIQLWSLDISNEFSNQGLLDLGMGPGRWSKFFLKYNFKSITGLDISPEMVKFARSSIRDRRFRAMRGDMGRLGIPDGSFDKVFCFRSLKYVPDYKGALKEMSRVLSKGGELIFEVPNKTLLNRILKVLSFFVISVNQNAKERTSWGYFYNVNFFAKAEIVEVIKQNTSLKIIKIKPFFILPSIKLPYIIDKYGASLLILLNKILFNLLPKGIFARSWVILAQKL